MAENDGLVQESGKEDNCQTSDPSLVSSSPPLLGKGPEPFLDGAFADIAFTPGNESADNNWLDSNLSIPRIDMIPHIDGYSGETFDDLFLDMFGFGGNWERLITSGRIKEATNAFESSIWYSASQKRQESEVPTSLEPSSQFIEEQYQGLSSEVHSSVPQRFSHCSRDDLFVTLVMHARDRSPECLHSLRRLFPPPVLLNALVHEFLRKQDRKVDSWIHSASFQPSSSNMELTTVVIAAGALNAPSAVLRKLGADLNRLLRPVILDGVRPGISANSWVITNHRT